MTRPHQFNFLLDSSMLVVFILQNGKIEPGPVISRGKDRIRVMRLSEQLKTIDPSDCFECQGLYTFH